MPRTGRRAEFGIGMTRQANAIDFWRGFALVSIFINHIPGVFYERLTHRNLSISDSAELFVFLAGWSLGLLVGSRRGAVDRGAAGGEARRPRADDLRGADPDQQHRAGYAGCRRLRLRQPAHSGMAQRGRGLPGPGAGAHRPRPAHAPARLFRHPAALRRPHAGGAADRSDRQVRQAAARAPLAGAISLVADRAVHGADLARSRPMVLQSVHLAGDLRARLRPVARRGARSGCAPQHEIDTDRRTTDRADHGRTGVVQLVPGPDASCRSRSSFSSTEKAS